MQWRRPSVAWAAPTSQSLHHQAPTVSSRYPDHEQAVLMSAMEKAAIRHGISNVMLA